MRLWTGCSIPRGSFVEGFTVPPARTELPAGQRVRYKTDRVTATNRHQPLVLPVLDSDSVLRPSVMLVGGQQALHISLTAQATRALCRSTTANVGKMMAGIFDRFVVGDALIVSSICGGGAYVTPDHGPASASHRWLSWRTCGPARCRSDGRVSR